MSIFIHLYIYLYIRSVTPGGYVRSASTNVRLRHSHGLVTALSICIRQL